MKSVQMKSILMSWAMSAAVAICVTPALRSLASRGAAAHPLTLAQDDAPMAVPGSADAQGPAGNGDYQSGQAAAPEDPDAAQQPPANMQQPGDDSGDDTSTQPQSGDADQGETPNPPSSGDDN